MASAHSVPEEHQQDDKGHGFQSAGRGSGGSADQHQENAGGFPGLGQHALIQGREAGRSERRGLEECGQKLFRKGERPQRCGVIPFQQKKKKSPGQQQRRGCYHDKPCINIPSGRLSLSEDLIPDQESQAAQDNEAAESEAYDRIPLINHQAGSRRAEAQDVESRVAEGGNRVKHAQPQRLCKRILRRKTEGQQQGARAFDAEGSDQQLFLMLHHFPHVLRADGFGHDQLLLNRDPAAKAEVGQRSRGHEPQSSDLNQDQDHGLTEEAPLSPCIRQGQPGHAGGGGCGKQGNEQTCRSAVPGRDRQIQQQGAQQNQAQKGQRHDPADADRLTFPLLCSESNHSFRLLSS